MPVLIHIHALEPPFKGTPRLFEPQNAHVRTDRPDCAARCSTTKASHVGTGRRSLSRVIGISVCIYGMEFRGRGFRGWQISANLEVPQRHCLFIGTLGVCADDET